MPNRTPAATRRRAPQRESLVTFDRARIPVKPISARERRVPIEVDYNKYVLGAESETERWRLIEAAIASASDVRIPEGTDVTVDPFLDHYEIDVMNAEPEFYAPREPLPYDATRAQVQAAVDRIVATLDAVLDHELQVFAAEMRTVGIDPEAIGPDLWHSFLCSGEISIELEREYETDLYRTRVKLLPAKGYPDSKAWNDAPSVDVRQIPPTWLEGTIEAQPSASGEFTVITEAWADETGLYKRFEEDLKRPGIYHAYRVARVELQRDYDRRLGWRESLDVVEAEVKAYGEWARSVRPTNTISAPS